MDAHACCSTCLAAYGNADVAALQGCVLAGNVVRL